MKTVEIFQQMQTIDLDMSLQELTNDFTVDVNKGHIMSLGHVENSITCAVGGSSHDDEEAVVTDLLGDPI